MSRAHVALLICAGALSACASQPRVGGPSAAPAPSTPVVASTTVPVPGGCSVPRRGPADAVGCYLAGTEQIGAAPATPLYWHIDRFATRAEAEAARRGRGTVTEAHGRAWLLTVADAEFRPNAGERMARVGPLPVTPGRVYAAHYIEGVVPGGARTPVHRHAGPEAWYVLEGAQCLETPDGFKVVRAGDTYIVPEGPPMLLVGIPPALRRTLVLVLHDAAQPWTLPPTSSWTPKDLCPKQ